MEQNNDSEISSLLCFENIKTCLDDFESDVDDGSITPPSRDHKNLNFNNQTLFNDNLVGSENLVGFFVLNDEIVWCLVKREKEQLPRYDYLNRLRDAQMNINLISNFNFNLSVVRMEAIDWIWKVHEDYGFGPCSLSLAVNYLDRFLSVYDLERDKDWSVQLLALACLSIAAKMEEGQTKVPESADIIGKPKFIFEAKGIQRMELLVLSHLNWKMQSITPCSFVDYFLRKMTNDPYPTDSSMLRSLELILSITKCIDLLEFKPSEIAAAVAIFVSKDLQESDINHTLTRFAIVDKDKILKCLEVMKNVNLAKVSLDLGSDSEEFEPGSPIGVLDAACVSSKSDGITVESSHTNSTPENPITKRLKFFHDGTL